MVLGEKESLKAPSDATGVVCIANSSLYKIGAFGAIRYRPRETIRWCRLPSAWASALKACASCGLGYAKQVCLQKQKQLPSSWCTLCSYRDIGKAKYKYWGTSRKVRDVKGFARILIRAVFVYLRLANKEYNFDVFDPVPDDDPRFGMPNKGQHMQYMLAAGLAQTYLSTSQSVLCNDFILVM